jgi:hypothetical protein
MFRDLKHPTLMYLKAGLFMLAGLMAGSKLVLQNPTWMTLALIGILAWCAARAYYFAFYVAQRYVDPTYRFSGLWSFLAHFMLRK